MDCGNKPALLKNIAAAQCFVVALNVFQVTAN